MERSDSVAGSWWEGLPVELRNRVDSLVLEDQRVAALSALFGSGVQRRPDLGSLEAFISDRYEALGERVRRKPLHPTLNEVRAIVAGITDPIVAIEALWDGDTRGWLVSLYAIIAKPSNQHRDYDEVCLGNYRGPDGDLRLFNNTAPPWIEAKQATTDGQTIADQIGVPFFFAHPEDPDLDVGRWWDNRR